jgi:hypothetical protein
MDNGSNTQTFFVKDCALVAIATGERASSLVGLREKLMTIHPGCIYYHFWGGRLHSQFAHPEDHNDFASWTRHSLHDLYLAERLAVIDPTEYPSIEELRRDLVDIIDDRIEEKEIIISTKKENQLHFIRSKTIVFDTALKMEKPSDLVKIIPIMSASSIFYHFIDARRRTSEAIDDFSFWLKDFDEPYRHLIHKIQAIDIYFLSLSEVRQKLSEIVTTFFNENPQPIEEK